MCTYARHGLLVVVFACLITQGCGSVSSKSERPTTPSQTTEADQQILVADWANHRIVQFNELDGTSWKTCGDQASGAVKLQFPTSVAVDRRGRVYVVEQHRPHILCFENITSHPSEIFPFPDVRNRVTNKYAGSWIFVDRSNRIYVSFGGSHRVARCDDIQGKNWVSYGTEGSGVGQFHYPAGIWVNEAGQIYVADFDNFRIVRMDDMFGANWITLGKYGDGQNEFINPCGIWGDPQGRVYVADQGNDRIVRFDDMQGKNWTAIGAFGTDRRAGKLYAPSGVCVDRQGRIYVSQCSSNHRLVRMDDMNGTNWTIFGQGGSGPYEFASPMGIFVD